MGLALILGLAAAAAALILCGSLIFIAYLKFFRAGVLSPSPTSDVELGADGGQAADVSKPAISPQKEADVRRHRWQEVEALLGGRAAAAVIGEGGFSTVYLARLPDSTLAALKVYAGGGGELPRRAFRQELAVLLRLRHPRIVRLLAYSDDRDEEGVLLLEYVPNGTLHEKLHGGGSTLPWAARTRVAYEVAGAVEYLHDGGGSSLPIVHGDLTTANVLLHVDLGPKLCDFGSARVGFSAAVGPAAPVVGSPGYTDPHYLRTGIASKKTDVYSFGVLLLELLTGRPAVGSEGGMTLAAAMAPRLRGAGSGVAEVVDPRLGGEYDEVEAAAMAAIAASCVGEQPTVRPSMTEIRCIMRAEVGSSVMSTSDEGSNGPTKETKE
ncbi:hypothetical protein MUK42_11188 [Musa troglodytarum]|uniref:Protein kinase domain-containing protein n=1 Tax=Musa troglodytarum TaxID=320322 RepID=A0A9E7H0S8_9LILI|nr:hypothetical protein MUK42_11188 [Musa troglodytarum]